MVVCRLLCPRYFWMAFLHPQAERIDGPEVDGHPLGVRDQDNLQDLLAGDYFRERLDVLELHLP